MKEVADCGVVVAEFKERCEIARRMWNSAISTLDYEGPFVQVLDLVRQNLHCRSMLSPIFIEYLRAFDFSLLDLIAFCMHELRWQEVFVAAQRMHGKSARLDEQHAMNCIMDAFEDDWSDRDLYPYFN